jgi:uncharacterized protein (DUF58 family)
MLPKEVIKKIKKIEIKAKYSVKDVFSGEYKSVFKGKGMEFLEVRPYLVGDDVRFIDWNVTSRMGSPYVKEFIEERELTLMILLDGSSSLQFGTKGKTKRELAAEIGGVLAYLTLRNNDKVGLIIFTEGVEKFVPPQKGITHVLRVIREMLYFIPKEKGNSLEEALNYVLKVMIKRGIVFIISDFFDKGYEKKLKVVSKKHDTIGVRILDPLELKFPRSGLIEIEDPETGYNVIIDGWNNKFLTEFYKVRKKWEEGVRKMFNSLELDWIDLKTNESYIEPLIKFFSMRRRRR